MTFFDKNFNSNTDNKEEWLTPPDIIKALGVFDLDPCAPEANIRPWDTALNHFTKSMNGLIQPWSGRIWCNPPYGTETFKWLDKLALHDNGIALIFARTETIGFHEQIWNKAGAIFFFKGRLKFYHVSGEQGGTANAPSCLIAYGNNNIKALRDCNLTGKFINLR